MEQKERMDQGLIYDPADNRISTEQTSCLDAQYEFNATRPSEMKKRAALLKQMLGHQSGLFELCPILLLGAEPAFFRRQYSRLSECSRPSKYFPV